MKLTAPARTPVATIRDEFDRLFDRFAKPGFFGPPARMFEAMWSPSLDFSENEKEYVARVEVPGMPRENLDVTVEGRTLTVSGHRDFEREEREEEFYWREREQGRFVRSVQLPTTVDTAKVVATCEDGIMTIRLPKTEPTPKSRITIK